MFSKDSRYRRQQEVSSVDAGGRTLVSAALRLLPPTQGKFRHLLSDNDRADQLADKYYKQPRKWWRICDANPQFMSPQALLGKDAMAEVRVPVRFPGTPPPWASVLASISARLGVETVSLERDWSLAAEQQVVGGQIVTVNVERSADAVRVTYNRLNLTASEIAALLTGLGFEVEPPQTIDRAGKPIVVPPDTSAARS
jgi:hypothetical protein